MKYLFFILCCFMIFSYGYSINRYRTSKSHNHLYRFHRSFGYTFHDMPDLQLEAAIKNGIPPLETRADTSKYMNQLIHIYCETDAYRVATLKYSIPYLVKKAAVLLSDISINFRDCLTDNKLPLYKIVITSMMRTSDDVKKLRRRNTNASENSAHCFGTTFDIAWFRYDKVNQRDKRNLDSFTLKKILGQVLNNLRGQRRCYVKYERKQSCFHITVR